jgi:phage terminase large subunit-like protein
MFGDPPKWATELESWADEFRIAGKTDEERERVLEFPTNSPQRMSRAVDRFLTAVRESTLSHTGDERLAAHVAAAHLKKVREKAEDDDQRTMYVIVKGDDGRKIDACIAAVLAYEAAVTMPEKPKARDLFLAVT